MDREPDSFRAGRRGDCGSDQSTVAPSVRTYELSSAGDYGILPVSGLYRRLCDVSLRTETGQVEERVIQMRQEDAENLEPTRSVKNEIIEKQDALIGLLYREEDASPEIRELKREVESKKAVLQKRRALFPKL